MFCDGIWYGCSVVFFVGFGYLIDYLDGLFYESKKGLWDFVDVFVVG